MAVPPVRLRGVADPAWLESSPLFDILEHIPDLQPGPQSVQVYGRMRREPGLTGVLAAYQLPIRRANWTINPAGCRPEVARLVADDLGLPVAGKDEPGAARTRGVSWPDYLRQALSFLVFGHAGHEMQAEIRGTQARLIGLYERVQSTIEEIHADRQGRLLGVSQEYGPGNKAPTISADRLVWHTHDQAGANWYGTSLLRPAYGMWMIKQDLVRSAAISNRRWGAGVPVMEALPGTNPTDTQMTQAMQLAAAARAGEQAGAATPPGFVMKILGLTGTVPDTLAYIRYCDASFSRMALAGFLDLGSSDTGSYALAKSFVDLFMLNLQATADAVADTVTRQVVARLVAWNFGPDEPVPAVQVSDVGMKHEVTAEALAALLQSGALSWDPALEEHLRRLWSLPAAPDGLRRPADPKAATRPSARRPVNTARSSTKASARLPALEAPPIRTSPKSRGRKSPPAGQLAFPFPAPRNEAADDTFAQMQADWEAAREALLDGWPDESQDLIDELADEAAAAVDEDRVDDLGDLAASAAVVAAIAAILSTSMTDLGALAAAAAVAELGAAGHETDKPEDPGISAIEALAAAFAAQLAGSYAAAAGRKALTMAGPDAVRDAIANAVRDHLADMAATRTGVAAGEFGAALSSAQAAARYDVFAGFPDVEYIATEVNDTARCSPCADVDGAVFENLAAAVTAYPVGGYQSCEGGSRCRGGYTVKP